MHKTVKTAAILLCSILVGCAADMPSTADGSTAIYNAALYDSPGVPDGTVIDAAYVDGLLQWIEHESGYYAPKPPIVIASKTKFRMVLKAKGVRYGDARAIYIPGMVVLDNYTWDPRDPMQVSLLVHDLVHHVQLYNARTYACSDAKEFEAYTLQNKWLEEHDGSFFASPAWIERMSQCPETEMRQAEAQDDEQSVNAAVAMPGVDVR